MTMKNPPHPGEIIRELCLEPLGLSWVESRPRSHRHLSITRPGWPGYWAIKARYQKFFGGNWGGVVYTRACQSASDQRVARGPVNS